MYFNSVVLNVVSPLGNGNYGGLSISYVDTNSPHSIQFMGAGEVEPGFKEEISQVSN